MILDDKIKVKISLKNIEHYSKFFDIKLKDIIEVNPSIHFQRGSNIKVNAKCDLCDTERCIKYQAYYNNINSCKEYPLYTCDKCSHIKIKEFNKKKYGCEYYSQHPERNDRVKNTSIEKFGTEHYSKTYEYIERRNKTNLDKFGFINPFMDKEKIKNSLLDKYNVINPSQVKEFRELAKLSTRKTREENNTWIPIDDVTSFSKYKRMIRKLTRNNVKLLEWDGTDFYDNEYIKENFTLNPYHNNYPTIDHKISIYEGFTKNIPVEEIANVNNLCWTKRIRNITKNKKSHY